MASIKDPIRDIIAKLTSLQVTNQNGDQDALYSRIFNDQIKRQAEGKCESFPLPAAFVEVQNQANYKQIGNGFNSSDVTFRIHLAHWFVDAQDGTMGQDFDMFDLKNSVITLLSGYAPTACGPLVVMDESQDYDHDNINVYLIDFLCHFIDSKGSPYDPVSGTYITKQPPTGLDLTVEYVDELP